MDGWIKLPGGNYLNLNLVATVAKHGLDGTLMALTNAGVAIQVQPPDSRALRALLDDVAAPVGLPPAPAVDLLGGGN